MNLRLKKYESENPVQQAVMRRLFSPWPIVLFISSTLAILNFANPIYLKIARLFSWGGSSSYLALRMQALALVSTALYALLPFLGLLLIFKVFLRKEVSRTRLELLKVTPLKVQQVIWGIVWPVAVFNFLLTLIVACWFRDGVFGLLLDFAHYPDAAIRLAQAPYPFSQIARIPKVAAISSLFALLGTLAFVNPRESKIPATLRLSIQLIVVQQASQYIHRQIFYAYYDPPREFGLKPSMFLYMAASECVFDAILIVSLWRWRIKGIDWNSTGPSGSGE
ncbi:hypothetical protein BH09SUM1_BH09SUM1_01500 [soil metagenome]